MLKTFPNLSTTLQREAAKAHLLYFVNQKKEVNLPKLVKAVKKELVAQFPQGKEAFNERFILRELMLRDVKSEALRKELKAFAAAEKGNLNTDSFKYAQVEKNASLVAKALIKQPDLRARLDNELSPIFKMQVMREVENNHMKGKVIKKGAKIPGSEFTVQEEARDYPVNSATEHQAKIDYQRSPRIFIDGKYHSFPDDKLFLRIEKKYGKLAGLLITQGKFDVAERFLFKELNPNFYEGDLGAYTIRGQHWMTYVIETKGEMVEFTYKTCKEVLESEKLEEGPVFYAPLEQVVLIPLSELKKGEIKTLQTTIRIHPSASSLVQAHKMLNMPALTPVNASKFVDDCQMVQQELREEYLDTAVSLLVNGGDPKNFLKKVSKKSNSIYQTMLKKVEEALIKQSMLSKII